MPPAASVATAAIRPSSKKVEFCELLRLERSSKKKLGIAPVQHL